MTKRKMEFTVETERTLLVTGPAPAGAGAAGRCPLCGGLLAPVSADSANALLLPAPAPAEIPTTCAHQFPKDRSKKEEPKGEHP